MAGLVVLNNNGAIHISLPGQITILLFPHNTATFLLTYRLPIPVSIVY